MLRLTETLGSRACAAQIAVAFEPAPHQIRSRRPSEWGSRRSNPGGFGNMGRGFGGAKPSPRNRSTPRLIAVRLPRTIELLIERDAEDAAPVRSRKSPKVIRPG